MPEITDGLGSMSAMLIIISIIAIGAVMAVRNKIVNIRRRRMQEESATSKPTSEKPTDTRPNTESEGTDIDSQLDQLKKDVND